MTVPQRARSWLVVGAFSTTLALSSPGTIYSAAARNVKRAALTDPTPSLAEQPSPPPVTVVTAVLDAGHSTGIDPALLLTIASTESRFRADAKNKASSAAGLLQFTKQTWLENMKTFGGKHGLSRLADQFIGQALAILLWTRPPGTEYGRLETTRALRHCWRQIGWTTNRNSLRIAIRKSWIYTSSMLWG